MFGVVVILGGSMQFVLLLKNLDKCEIKTYDMYIFETKCTQFGANVSARDLT